uniref:Exostosin GT47 domain-containing protein n=1 Tax=Oryza rufipogon TaxID=4529 RepID=A0A0E0Q0L4_ORYRU
MEMERSFRVFVYPDGDPGTFYQTPRKLTGKYASEGYRFRTDDLEQAHLFFVPISPHKMRGKGTSYENMTIIVQNYVESLINKYPYWNRTLGGGNDIENRTILGFWAGHRNSKIRVILARIWENDTELAISNNRINRAIGNLVYQKQFFRTKFCVCPGSSQVNSARISDSIHYGCMPVILSDYYDLPFSGILNWRKFAVVLKESDVYELKSILKSLSQKEFVSLHKSLVQVQKHFEWHSPPVPYDAFHMIMYELWLRHHVIKY